MEALRSTGDNFGAALDGLAQIHLIHGELGEAAAALDRITNPIQFSTGRRLYVYRHSLLTRAQLLARQLRWKDAVNSAETVIQLANEAGDQLLGYIGLLTKAELLQQMGNDRESMDILTGLIDALAQQPPDLYAHYERIVACALAAAGDRQTATFHFDRARRIYEGIRSAPGLVELSRRWNEATGGDPAATSKTAPAQSGYGIGARDMVQTVAALLRHHSRPELVARELVHVLRQTGAIVEARAVPLDNARNALTLFAREPAEPAPEPLVERRIPIGSAAEGGLALELKTKRDIESEVTLNAVRLIVATIEDLERARAEREQRISLWPADEDAGEDGRAVVNGALRSLMSSARRIAQTKLTVFITGESGSGKEIVARAIHAASDRAARPFIAFNCAAVPRDMIESQLFGYRRGSFTGADRDHAGIIGAARDGTLFLDEIAELSLDLQPKLLRFLESGEICPIGESAPFPVDVRVVAATNSTVEQLLKEGRFREDLFYRLNVIRLKIPPLRERRDEIPALVRHFVAQSSGEFKKGDVRVSEETMEHLLLCRWPGNIRQLQNEIRRMVALAEPDSVLTPEALSDEVFNARLARPTGAGEFEMVVSLKGRLIPAVEEVEREMIRRALADHQGNLDAAARALGISRKGLYLKRQRLGL
jgi:DNA-binding NtrC family response regulator